MENGEIILYTAEDGSATIKLRAEGGTVWLSRMGIADLFQTTPQNITLHIQTVCEEDEVDIKATSKDCLLVQIEGTRSVQREVKLYNLNMILAIGYRVRSSRGTQFRKWATTILQEYLVKGFAMDDERLKNPSSTWDYFDEWLERIREIRASEKRFYQKVRDIYATAIDYDPKSDQAQFFFKKVQNKMLWAATHHTAPEIIVERSDPNQSNMGLTSWEGSRVRQQDVTIAKNYLNQPELQELNEIVVMYLDYAENQAKRRKVMTMVEWEQKLDAFLTFNEKDLLNHAGKISAEVAKKLVLERYVQFDEKRQQEDKQIADAEDIALLEALQEKANQIAIDHEILR